ncbi:hypothetical protein [Allofustis seminis]|uniref:hypothetical protein n=1 Tax=Allofustis seminis TaxID=166939 RepID=UPI000381973F|nr:hypothetical protein [Allofustis seminis]
MRADQKIEMVKESKPQFNPNTGNYDESSETVFEVWASVSDTSEEQMQFLYGNLKRGSYIIRVHDRIGYEFDFIRMNDRKYQVDNKRELRRFTTFYVSEKQ